MIDRKKVCKGLYAHGYKDCKSCPYWGSGPHGSSECKDLAREALFLLREQETVEPVVHCKDANLSNGADFACSGCGGSFLHKVVNFCPWCGKKVKWNET